MTDLLSNSAAVPLAEIAAEEARLALFPHQQRRADLIDALQKVDVRDEEEMRRAVDKIALSSALRREAETKVEPIGAPYREAGNAVRGVALNFLDPLRLAEQAAHRSINEFRARQRQAAADAKNAQLAREAELRRQAGLEVEQPALVRPEDVHLAPARSDYRGQVFDRRTTTVTILDPRLLPDEVLKSPGVTAALETAVRRLSTLTRDIPGALLEDGKASSVKV